MEVLEVPHQLVFVVKDGVRVSLLERTSHRGGCDEAKDDDAY